MDRVELVEEYSQLPSKTGKDVIELEEYAKLPRTVTYERIRRFLEDARKSKELRALFIVAEWGEGKTSICEGLLKRPEVIKTDIVIPISTKRLITTIKESANEFTDTKSLGIRLFACLLYAIKDVIENDLLTTSPFNRIKIRTKSENEATILFIRDGIEAILNAISPESRVFIFLDEFEDIVDEDPDVQSFVITGLVDMINGYPRYLCQEPYAGRFHLLIAVTPSAYAKIKSKDYTEIGRLFGQRILEVQLEKLDRKSAYEFILGVLRYCWKGRLPRIPFSMPGMLNAIYLATLGNPRAILNVLILLLTGAKIRAPQGKVRVIDPELFVSILSGQRIQVYGGEISIINEDMLTKLRNKIEQKCHERGIREENVLRLMDILLSSPAPISKREIKNYLEIKDDEEYSCYLGIIQLSFKEIWGIDQPFLIFRKVLNKDEVYSKIESEGDSTLREILKSLEFYNFSYDIQSLVNEIFVPYEDLDDIAYKDRALYQNFINFFIESASEVRDEDSIRIAVNKISKIAKKSNEIYITLAPIALNIFYPSPSMVFLDFIEDPDKRFEVGMKLMHNFIEFESEYYRGILQLLQDGGKNVEVELVREQYGFKDIDVLKLKYSEIAQEYHVRAKILPLLKMSEVDIENKLKNIVEEMRLAGIPLLLVFSWNPLPLEIRAKFDAELSGEVFHYINFPLSTLQCHQVIGYIIAKNYGYKVREEKWKARALKILSELKFEDELRRYIEEGTKKGYTIRPLQLEHLRARDVVDVLRTLIITEGSVEKRFEHIRELDRKFRVYGKKFPINPKDIESKDQLERFIRDLIRNGFVEEVDGSIKVRLTEFERRILTILKEFNGSIERDKVDKFFVTMSSGSSEVKASIYLDILLEKEKITYDRDRGIYSMKSMDDLRLEFEDLKKRLDSLQREFLGLQYGYLASIKGRDINAIILRNCIDIICDIAKSLEPLPLEQEERWIGRFKLFKLLFEQLEGISQLVRKFSQGFHSIYLQRTEVSQVKRALEQLENDVNLLNIFGKNIRIKEKSEVERKEDIIKKIRDKSYSEHEIKSKAEEHISKIIHKKVSKDLYSEFRGCPFFDVKILELASNYEELQELVHECKEKIQKIRESIEHLRRLQESLDTHEIYKLKYDTKETPISALLLRWIHEKLST